MSGPRSTPLYDVLHRHAEDGPGRPAVTWNDQTLTYEQLRAASCALAEAFRSARLGAGDRVAIIAPNVPALVVSLFAAWRAGAVAVPLSARLREHDLASALEVAEPTAVVSVASHHGFSFADLLCSLEAQARLRTVRQTLVVDALGAVREARAGEASATAEPVGADVGLLMFTSGTTGEPRAALLGHERELVGGASLAETLGLTATDTTVLVIPASHAFGLTCVLSAIRSGGHAVLVDSTFSPEPMVTAVQHWDATILHGSPTLFAALAKSSTAPPPNLRAGFVAGAPCPGALIERLSDAGVSLLSLYGMTEIGAATATRLTDPWPARRTTVGRPLPTYELRTVDGEVQVRGPCVTAGYFREPALTAAMFDGPWLRTGDLGELDGDGYLRIIGRLKDLAKVAGFTVAPAEVETVLLGHPYVLQAVVVAVPNDVLGEALRAFVVTRGGSAVASAALIGYARRRLAGYKLPYLLQVVPELPVLPSGKPDRAALRARTPS